MECQDKGEVESLANLRILFPLKGISGCGRPSCCTGERDSFCHQEREAWVPVILPRCFLSMGVLPGWHSELWFYWGLFWFWFCFVFHFFLHPVSQGALEEQLALSGDGAYNAHFGESIASLGDLDDDGFPGQ